MWRMNSSWCSHCRRVRERGDETGFPRGHPAPSAARADPASALRCSPALTPPAVAYAFQLHRPSLQGASHKGLTGRDSG